MKKKPLLSLLALCITFALFNVIAFVVPTDKTTTFWIAYGFSVFAFVAQIPLWAIAFGKKDTLKSKFLGIPVVRVGVTYLIVQLIAFAVFMLLPWIAPWIAIVTCSIILAVSALCVIAGHAGEIEITRVENTIKAKRAFIQFLQADIEMLAKTEEDAATKIALGKLAEQVRFSDPMSPEMLGELEARISAKVEEIKTAADKKALIEEVTTLLTERNKKCKILK